MKESYEQGLASQFGPESYADDGNIMGVALNFGVHTGQPLSSEISNFRVPTLSNCGEGYTRHSVIGELCRDAAESKTLCMCGNSRRENREPEAGNLKTHEYSFLFDGTIGAELLADRIRLHFVDGARGDSDLTRNGTIVDPGGPGFNPAPIVQPVVGPDAAVPQQPVAFSTSFTDLGSQPHTATIHWGDGTTTAGQVNETPGSGIATADHIYATPGNYLITISVTDDLGNVTSVEKLVLVSQLLLQNDPENPGKSILTVGGTNQDDHIDFKPKKQRTVIEVTLNGKLIGRFYYDELSRLVAFGGAGDDKIKVHGQINLETELHGGAGNDHIHGGRGNDVIFGEEGLDWLWGLEGDDLMDGGSQNDHLYGGSGNDILLGQTGDDMLIGGLGQDLLIGGAGRDILIGGDGDDLLIGGTTSFDQQHVALRTIRDEWASGKTYAERVANLSGGTGPNLLSGESVFDDDDEDMLIGNDGLDWFFASLSDDLIRKKFDKDLVIL